MDLASLKRQNQYIREVAPALVGRYIASGRMLFGSSLNQTSTPAKSNTIEVKLKLVPVHRSSTKKAQIWTQISNQFASALFSTCTVLEHRNSIIHQFSTNCILVHYLLTGFRFRVRSHTRDHFFTSFVQ